MFELLKLLLAIGLIEASGFNRVLEVFKILLPVLLVDFKGC